MMLEGCSSGWPDEGVSWLSPGIKAYALVGTFVPTAEGYCRCHVVGWARRPVWPEGHRGTSRERRGLSLGLGSSLPAIRSTQALSYCAVI